MGFEQNVHHTERTGDVFSVSTMETLPLPKMGAEISKEESKQILEWPLRPVMSMTSQIEKKV